MTRTHTYRRGRAAFTLIELLVVIAILAVLMGTLLVAIMPILGKGPEVKARKDLSLLGTSITSFLSDQKVSYLPSRLLLREDGNYSAGDQLTRDSRLYLKKLFTKIDLTGKVGYDWNGDGTIDTGSSGVVVLDGSQCMVFLLGGVNGLKGFSTNPSNPLDFSRKDRIGPFHPFEASRLVGGGGFPRYIDPWSTQPYAYFSAYGKLNGYSKYGSSDCPSVVPYFSVDALGVQTFYNSNSFQIITAGKDLTFGPGGNWGPNVAIPGATQDDMANFHSARLGSP